MVRYLILVDAITRPSSATRPNYANIDKALVISFLSFFALAIILYIMYQCFCLSSRSTEINRIPGESADATAKRLATIPVTCYQDTSPPQGGDIECAVCLTEYKQGEEVRVLPACRHVFHRVCVDQWLLGGSWLCPICREPVADRAMKDGSSSITVATAEAEDRSSRRPRSSC